MKNEAPFAKALYFHTRIMWMGYHGAFLFAVLSIFDIAQKRGNVWISPLICAACLALAASRWEVCRALNTLIRADEYIQKIKDLVPPAQGRTIDLGGLQIHFENEPTVPPKPPGNVN